MASSWLKKFVSLISAASLIAQAIFFVGSVFLIADLFSLTYVITPDMAEDASLPVRYVLETVDSYMPLIGAGVLGAIAAYLIYKRNVYRAPWFSTGARVLGWFWLPFLSAASIIVLLIPGAT